MKKLFLTLVLVFIVAGFALAEGPEVHDDVKNASLSEIADNSTRFWFGTGPTWGSRLWSVEITAGDGNGDWDLIEADGDPALKLLNQTGNASDSGSADTWCAGTESKTYVWGVANETFVNAQSYSFGSAISVEWEDVQ